MELGRCPVSRAACPTWVEPIFLFAVSSFGFSVAGCSNPPPISAMSLDDAHLSFLWRGIRLRAWLTRLRIPSPTPAARSHYAPAQTSMAPSASASRQPPRPPSPPPRTATASSTPPICVLPALYDRPLRATSHSHAAPHRPRRLSRDTHPGKVARLFRDAAGAQLPTNRPP